MRITKTGTYVLTGIAVAMFVFLSLIFDTLTRFELSGPWFSQLNERVTQQEAAFERLQLGPTGHSTSFMNYGRYYPTMGR